MHSFRSLTMMIFQTRKFETGLQSRGTCRMREELQIGSHLLHLRVTLLIRVKWSDVLIEVETAQMNSTELDDRFEGSLPLCLFLRIIWIIWIIRVKYARLTSLIPNLGTNVKESWIVLWIIFIHKMDPRADETRLFGCHWKDDRDSVTHTPTSTSAFRL